MGKRIVILLCLLFCSAALADTGGHMSGGDWSSSSSSSSSGRGWSGGYSSSSSSSDYSPSYDSSYSYSSSRHTALPWWAYLVLIGLGLVVQLAKSGLGSSNSMQYMPTYTPSAPADAVDVSVLRIGIDGRSRKFVQDELARIAKTADGATPEGRLAMLREVTMMLRRIKDAWIYGGAINEQMSHKQNAKQIFDRHVAQTREKFRHETVANVQGQHVAKAAGDEYIPRSSEGAGVILVSIVIATRTELFTVLKIAEGEHLRLALESAGAHTANDIVALDIIWQPSEDSDRMSSIELEAKYPHPQLIKIQNALAGKTFCAYCAGPFPAELVSCPHCGAPAREAA